MKRHIWTAGLTALILSLWAAPYTRADEAVSLKAGFMSLDASGHFASTAGGVAGTPVDVSNTINLKRSNNVTLEGALQLGDFRLGLNYLPLDFSGTSVLTSNITFNGQTHNAGDTVDTSLKAKIYDASLTWYLVNMDDLPSRVQFGPELAVKFINADVSMNNLTTPGVSSTQSASLPIPTIGARGRVALADFLGLAGRIGFIGYAGNRFVDAEAQLEFSPLPTLGLYAGYRYIDVKFDQSGLQMDTRFQGPFAGGFFRF